MNIAKLTTMYTEAEKRAVPCVGGVNGQGGMAFRKEDRAALVAEMWRQGLTHNQAAYAMGKELGGFTRILGRLKIFENQVLIGKIRLGAAPTGEHVGKTKEEETFDGRIRTKADIQPAFNRAARQLIKIGITSPNEAFKYVTNAFETAKVEQKIDLKAERIVKELQMGDLTKDQVLATLERVKKNF